MVSICLVVLVSLELCNSIEVPYSAFKPSHAQLYSQTGKATEHLLQGQYLWHLALILEGYRDSLTKIEVSLLSVTCLHQ